MFVLILSTVLIQMAIGENCPTQAQLATGSGCDSDCSGTPTFLKLKDGTECPDCINCQNLSLKEDGNCPDLHCNLMGRSCKGGEMRTFDRYFDAEDGQTCQLCGFLGCW